VIGWLLFVASASFFIVSSLESRDLAGLLGSVAFLVACGVFLWPLLASRGSRDGQ
jgi:hypothetical protein